MRLRQASSAVLPVIADGNAPPSRTKPRTSMQPAPRASTARVASCWLKSLANSLSPVILGETREFKSLRYIILDAVHGPHKWPSRRTQIDGRAPKSASLR
jgi:hypothetical protein